MKKILAVLIIGLGLTAQAQTNPPSLVNGLREIGSAFSSGTNWTAAALYGRALAGNRNLAAVDVAYNFNQYVGVIVGGDHMWSSDAIDPNPAPGIGKWKSYKPTGSSDWNAVRGGITLSAQVHPFAFLGGDTFLSRMEGTPFVSALIATPKSGAAIGALVVTGIKLDLVKVKNFSLGTLLAYEHRSGQGGWDGNYGLIGLTATRKF